MKNKLVLMLPLLLLPLLSMATDAMPGKTPPMTHMVTRQVKFFGDLENKLIEATNAKDEKAMSHLLADDFILRTGANPADATNRPETIQEALKGTPLPARLEQLSVLDHGSIAVVSFIWDLDAPGNEAYAKRVFVVDTWRQVDGDWKLSARFASEVGKSELHVPGHVPHAQAPNKKI